MVKAPTPEEEDQRHICRERKTLTAERVEHVNRIKGLLFAQGISDYEPDLTGCFWTGLIERINSNRRSPGCPEVERSARSRSSRRYARSRCNSPKA